MTSRHRPPPRLRLSVTGPGSSAGKSSGLLSRGSQVRILPGALTEPAGLQGERPPARAVTRPPTPLHRHYVVLSRRAGRGSWPRSRGSGGRSGRRSSAPSCPSAGPARRLKPRPRAPRWRTCGAGGLGPRRVPGDSVRPRPTPRYGTRPGTDPLRSRGPRPRATPFRTRLGSA
jgi:hypothetical protein